MMTFAYQVLVHTPLWVWTLLAYLVWQDADLACADRSDRIHRLGHFADWLRTSG
ncbi:hypothetical protein ACVWXL_005972 [Bradyrhizobium sp. GM22.5]